MTYTEGNIISNGPKSTFPGPIKRRRMKSGGAASVITATNSNNNNNYTTVEGSSSTDVRAVALNSDNEQDQMDASSEEKTTQTSKCKGATTIPIFLKSKSFWIRLVA